ncbi:MAG: hypothetical protein IIT98_04520 [Kiritimatiellae bacterium]|nr:hypothetical protein [Kiritimatiellia bacterium]
MKKLMIAAAVAAIGAGAFASGSQAQVYDAKITVKTTVCKTGKVSNGYLTQIEGYERGDSIAYRAQGSRTILGLLWGCGCDEAFAGAWDVANKKDDGTKYWYGNLFWDKKTGEWIGDTFDSTVVDFGTNEGFINRIGKKANEVEMYWILEVNPSETDDGTEPGVLNNAGFGKISDSFALEDSDDEDSSTVTCDSVIKSAKGNTAGFLPAPGGETTDCEYCQAAEGCEAWDFCACEDSGFNKPERTAATGTWTLKYNKSASSKLSAKGYIHQAGVKSLPKDRLEELKKLGE